MRVLGFRSGVAPPRWLVVLTAVAFLAAAAFGTWWLVTSGDDAYEVASERDAVVEDLSEALVVLHTIDHASAEEALDAWAGVTTGRLGDDMDKDRQLHIDRAAGTKSVSTAELQRIAVSELNVARGTARVLAVLDVRLSAKGQPAKPHRSRLTVLAKRTDDGWKVSEIQAAGA